MQQLLGSLSAFAVGRNAEFVDAFTHVLFRGDKICRPVSVKLKSILPVDGENVLSEVAVTFNGMAIML